MTRLTISTMTLILQDIQILAVYGTQLLAIRAGGKTLRLMTGTIDQEMYSSTRRCFSSKILLQIILTKILIKMIS